MPTQEEMKERLRLLRNSAIKAWFDKVPLTEEQKAAIPDVLEKQRAVGEKYKYGEYEER